MLVRAELKEILHGDRGMAQGVRACLEAKCIVSAATLIYAMIDALSALTRPIGSSRTSGHIFCAWLAEYADCGRINCSPAELWAARCGVLHLYGPESDVLARNIYYEWQEGPPASSEMNLPDDSLVLVIEDLFRVALNAADKFAVAADKDEELARAVKQHISNLFCYKPF